MKETEKVGGVTSPVEERWLLYGPTFPRLTHLRIFFTTITDTPPPISRARFAGDLSLTLVRFHPWGHRAAQWERAVQRSEREDSSPVHHGVSVEGHEENLTATS